MRDGIQMVPGTVHLVDCEFADSQILIEPLQHQGEKKCGLDAWIPALCFVAHSSYAAANTLQYREI